MKIINTKELVPTQANGRETLVYNKEPRAWHQNRLSSTLLPYIKQSSFGQNNFSFTQTLK